MPSVCGCRGPIGHFYRYFLEDIALCLQSMAVMDLQATFTDTDTFTEISSMEVALCLVMALWLQSVTVVDG